MNGRKFIGFMQTILHFYQVRFSAVVIFAGGNRGVCGSNPGLEQIFSFFEKLSSISIFQHKLKLINKCIN